MRIRLGDAFLRSYLPEDAARLAHYASDTRVTEFMRETETRQYAVAEAAAWIDFVRAQQPECHFAIALDDALIGGIGLELQPDVYAHSAEISYWIAEAHWGRGFATRAVAALSEHAFGTLGLVRLYARVFDGNDASRRVLEKCGYEVEGRLRSAAQKDAHYVDQWLYSRVTLPQSGIDSRSSVPPPAG